MFDTNVVLDVLLAREPFFDPAARLFALVDEGRVSGALCATTLTTISYIASKDFSRKKAKAQLKMLLELFEVAPVDQAVIGSALGLDFVDFEDAVLHESAKAFGASAIVTRDRDDFLRSTIPVFDPVELLAAIKSS